MAKRWQLSHEKEVITYSSPVPYLPPQSSVSRKIEADQFLPFFASLVKRNDDVTLSGSPGTLIPKSCLNDVGTI